MKIARIDFVAGIPAGCIIGRVKRRRLLSTVPTLRNRDDIFEY
jgi:hypothetical protein